MSKIIQAPYSGRYPSGTLHLDNGIGRPLCYGLSVRDNPEITWVVVAATEPTCTICKRRRRASERERLGAA